MKKILYVAVPVLVVLAVIIGVLVLPDRQSEAETEIKGITVLDARGEVLFAGKAKGEIYQTEHWAYLELVLAQTADIIAGLEACTDAEAQQRLFTGGYRVQTAFDSTAFDALKIVGAQWGEDCDAACAVTDLDGSLLAVYSTDLAGNKTNFTLERRSPYSSFKALSVYTPAVEKGIVNWSSMYQDSPYKQLEGKDWPVNASSKYSQKDVTVYEALRTSLNTVAVKCLADVGISDAMAFLQTELGIPLREEEYVVQTYGEEEVIGSIALGYLETGITPVEMAGYYQIFATGGVYVPPECVEAVTGEDGTALYTRQKQPRQVISAATADTVNKLLQGVLARGGTGTEAQCPDIEIAGKTGTGDEYADNWFVGVTPGYSLAVWHGQHTKNQAALMFSAVIQALYAKQPQASTKFITHKNLYQIAYCSNSGMAFSPDCSMIEVGYFPSQDALPECTACGKN